MSTPELSPPIVLLVFALGSAAAAAFLWPRWGLVWRWNRLLRRNERIDVEDALKHLYDCEYRDEPATLRTLCGALEISGNDAAALVGRLQSLGLVASAGGSIQLTAEGRHHALRVIRVHRLWEVYLATKTGVDEERWHSVADRREHGMSKAAVEALSAKLGHPRFDPHGAPIPTAAGDIPPSAGDLLTELEPGELAKIVYIEDEPDAVYARIVAAGLRRGMRLRVLEKTHERIDLETDGDACVLAPLVAANISVVRVPRAEAPLLSHPHLAEITPGEPARIVRISPSCRAHERRRLMDLGLVPGTIVTPELTSPGGDPTAYRVRGSLIALRRTQAEHVQVEPREP